MKRFSYLRVSTGGQSVEAQRAALAKLINTDAFHEFKDEGVSGAIPAMARPGFKAMYDRLRAGDEVYVYELSRLGRDSIDVQSVVEDLLTMKVRLVVKDIGVIEGDTGRLVAAVISQLAAIERRKIVDRTSGGKAKARETFEATGKTHRGKTKLGGRDHKADAAVVINWRQTNSKSIAETAAHFGLSPATVKRYANQTARA
jgi:putative DNA-invertase from lambdoid prophage Rac